jgi:two-component system, sensor histidine kinase YesM
MDKLVYGQVEIYMHIRQRFSVLGKLTLKSKLIVSFIGFVTIPLAILSIFSLKLYSEEIQQTVIKSSVQSNEQINKNLDTFLGMLSKLSEYPVKDNKVKNLLIKDYTKYEYAEYEEAVDKDDVKDLLYNNIKSYSNIIDSVMLYKGMSYKILGRTPADSLNASYSPADEGWFKKLQSLDGACAIVGVHRDFQQSPRGNYVISVGRAIINSDTRKVTGYIIINVRVENLEKLWADVKLTTNSKFYLVDENNNIVFSKDNLQINKNIGLILGESPVVNNSGYIIRKLGGDDYYLISSKSRTSNWTVLSVIPKRELFSYINRMFYISILLSVIISILSVTAAVLIATSVTKPLYKLNQKMKLVGQGNFEVEIDKSSGEVGDISLTVQKMIYEIKRLISKIYQEEEEKRNAEMNALQAQVNPHFLYNTLNTIKWMASMQGATSIESALSSLSSLFTFIARSSGDFIPIRDEIKFLQEYLSILDLRYYNRFTVDYEIDEEVYRYKTLKFLLQPVVENAVFHGIEGVDRKGVLKVRAICENDKILIFIEDNGKGIADDILMSIFEEENKIANRGINSIGIPNIQKRIKLFFGNDYGLSIKSTADQGTTVMLTIPAIPLEN